MAAKRKSSAKKPGGSKSLVNKNQRKQLEALGYVDPPKKKAKKKAKKRP